MLLLVASLISPSHAGSLDRIEVGGMWGTPAATNPTATWWNPSGLAAGKGTQFLVEGAPTLANITYDRTEPDYTSLPGPPSEYDPGYGGVDKIRFFGPIPFLGVSSDLGIDSLGLGLSLSVPFATGGREVDGPGPGSFHLREGAIQAIYLTAGAGWSFGDVLSIGLSGSVVQSQWDVVTDVVAMTDINKEAAASGANSSLYCEDNQTGPCDDAGLEHPDYKTTLDFDRLRTGGFTFGGGLTLKPADEVAISVAYNHGVRLEHSGDLRFTSNCPPANDVQGEAAAELTGLCTIDGAERNGATADGAGFVDYDLPGRIHGGILLQPVERVRLELMGGYVFWSVFQDFNVRTEFQADEFQDERCGDAPCSDEDQALTQRTAELVSQDRKMARDNRNTFWVGIDGKVDTGIFTFGGRAIYDRSAIPTASLAPSNFDANTLGLGALAAVSPIDAITIGLSFNQYILATRTVTNSAFGVTMVESQARPDRYFYPTANGTYSGSISRLGISVRGTFGAKET